MLDDEIIEDIAQTAKKTYMDTTNMEEFVDKMDEFHFSTPHYVFRIMYYSIEAFDQ